MPLLDLSRAPAVLFFYGLSGAGKSWVGDVIGRASGRSVYHADVDLTGEMKDALREARPFDDGMRDRYFVTVAAEIRRRRATAGPLIVTQGVYRRRHRRWLRSQIDDMEMILVTAPSDVILKRLGRRSAGITVDAATALARDFDDAEDGDKTLINDGGAADVVAQMRDWFP
ncbi:MAG: hypothetical protein Q8O67_03245 [Deltaproteobacteria bacterium]|nr:hypothetical protein [Deltaproteobacteria bacterium]